MKPLAGLRVAVTRPATPGEELGERLRAEGAIPVAAPLIRIEPLEAGEKQRAALQAATAWDWLVFTSVNGVRRFREVWSALQSEPARIGQVACVGPATAAAAREAGYPVALIPEAFTGQDLAAALVRRGLPPGTRILVARGAGGDPALPEALTAAGAQVLDLWLYRSAMDQTGAETLRKYLNDGQIDLITFTSGSALRYFVKAVATPHEVRLAVLGSSTANVAHACGLRVDIQARSHTIADLVAAIRDHYAALGGPAEDRNVGK